MKYGLELAAGVVLAGVMLLAASMVMTMVFFNVTAADVDEYSSHATARSPLQIQVDQAEQQRLQLAAEKAQLQRQREVAQRQQERRLRLQVEGEQQAFDAQYAPKFAVDKL